MKKWTKGAITVHLFGMWKQVIVNPTCEDGRLLKRPQPKHASPTLLKR